MVSLTARHDKSGLVRRPTVGPCRCRDARAQTDLQGADQEYQKEQRADDVLEAGEAGADHP
jgi:hypothetical protein